MAWAQWTMLVLIFGGLLVAANEHGKPRKGIANFWTFAIASAINVLLLYFAGAFSTIFR